MKTVVSFADQASYYQRAQKRLSEALDKVGFDGLKLMYSDYKEIGGPHHKEVPYAFKAYSLKKAIEEGAELILWCDSVLYATKSLDPVFNHIKEKGYLLFDNIGYSLSDYTNDNCLDWYSIKREYAKQAKHLMACCMGFNLKHQKGKELLYRYIAAADSGVFQGSWENHRHDQSAAGCIAHLMKLEITNAQSTYFAYELHRGKVPISDSVCLWSGGL